MNLPKLQALITWLTSALVLAIALISFVLSYHALQGVASANGLNTWYLSYLWPLLLDGSLIVYSLCVVTAHLHNESTWRQWTLIGVSTFGTILFNTLYAWPDMIATLPQRIIVTGVPPVMLFFSFELLMSQLRNSVKRNTHVQELTQQVDTLQQQVDSPMLVRRQQVAAMLGSKTQKVIAGELGVSVGTIQKDIKALNGSIK